MSSIFTGILDGEILAHECVQVPIWSARPFQLVSLLEMLEFQAYFFVSLMLHLYALEKIMDGLSTKYGVDTELSDDDEQQVKILLIAIDTQCDRFELNASKSHISHMTGMIARGCRAGRLCELTRGLRERIDYDLSEQRFMYIPRMNADYYEQPELFGNEVYKNFESTRDDVQEAGNCYATGRYTACVFHCMRVLEKGLHALVNDLNSNYNAGITFKKQVEYMNWHPIIEEIDNAIKIRPSTWNPVPTSQDLQFYSRAAKEFQYFKDAWRNSVSHSRSSYDQVEAESVLRHVRDFMKHLAAKLKE